MKECSIAKAKLAFDYLMADQTRLMPAAALESIYGSVLGLVEGASRDDAGTLARMLAEDVDAIAFMRMPQLPSSRAFGDAPAVTTDEYQERVPKDPALQQIIPVPARQFPDELRDPDLMPPPRRPSDDAALAWGTIAVAGVLALIWRATRRR